MNFNMCCPINIANKFACLRERSLFCSEYKYRENMAIAIKSIPVLTGKAAERFVSMADANKGNSTTAIPKDMRAAINRMKERSKSFTIKYPQK